VSVAGTSTGTGGHEKGGVAGVRRGKTTYTGQKNVRHDHGKMNRLDKRSKSRGRFINEANSRPSLHYEPGAKKALYGGRKSLGRRNSLVRS